MRTEYNRLFDNITSDMSDDEVLFGALRKAENMENKTSKRSFKKPIIAACAAVGVLAAGVTGAAAAGWLDFNEVFGIISAEDEQLGSDLLSTVEDIRCYVSDDAYTIKLNGVTGDDDLLIASLELCRTDGKAITEGFINPYDESEALIALDGAGVADNTGYVTPEYFYSINENGNLDIDVQVTAQNSISGKTITLMGRGLYPLVKYSDFITANGILSSTINELEWVDSDMNKISPDFSSVAYLDLDWSVEFEYSPSETALDSISREFLADESFLINYIDDGVVASIECELVSFELEPIGYGTLTFKGDLKEYLDNQTIIQSDCSVKLIKKNGDVIETLIRGLTVRENTYQFELICLKTEEGIWRENAMAVDLSTIESFYVNGTVYPLG